MRLSLCNLAIVTFLAYRVIPVNMTTAGFAYLLLVLVVASIADRQSIISYCQAANV